MPSGEMGVFDTVKRGDDVGPTGTSVTADIFGATVFYED